MAWRDTNLLSLRSRNDPFSEGAYLCFSDKYRGKSSPASELTVIQYWLLIPGNFFQIGQAGDCIGYLNVYLVTTQEILEVLQWKQSLGRCYKTIFTWVMRAENAPEQVLTDIVVEGTGAGLSARTALVSPTFVVPSWTPECQIHGICCLSHWDVAAAHGLDLPQWSPCIWQEFLVALKPNEPTERLQCILER